MSIINLSLLSKKRVFVLFLLCSAVFQSSCSEEEPQNTDQGSTTKDQRPNIVYILADDIGYADLGVFGSEIPTPNLDKLAMEGMLMTDFHTGLACSPTRAMLMSGTDNHIAGLGVMSPSAREDQRNAPGYEAHLNFRIASLADLMSDSGYNTYMTGKWHLGDEVETGPRARGFKRSFVSLSGGAHLGGLSWNGPGLAPYRDGNDLVTVDEDFYTTEFFTSQMIDYIEQDRDEDKPFFAWLAYTAPHWPLQAPANSIARFEGQYDEGYEALYRNRFHSMQGLGLIDEDAAMFEDNVWQQRWEDLSEEEQRYSARRMEIYAAMISDLDIYVGQFIDYLKAIGEYDNTFIIFSSDNGAESTRRELSSPVKEWVDDCCDNSYENLGAADSYVMYGRDWATASTVAHSRHKATGFEGGKRVPAFAWFPSMIEPGQTSDGFSTVMDLLPTFLDLAGSQHPGTMYRGQVIEPLKGRSLLPQLSGETSSVHPEDEYTGWELYGHRSIRQGDWKITWDASMNQNAHWMLFNLATDETEQIDLGPENPEKLAQMITLWDQYAEENGVIY